MISCQRVSVILPGGWHPSCWHTYPPTTAIILANKNMHTTERYMLQIHLRLSSQPQSTVNRIRLLYVEILVSGQLNEGKHWKLIQVWRHCYWHTEVVYKYIRKMRSSSWLRCQVSCCLLPGNDMDLRKDGTMEYAHYNGISCCAKEPCSNLYILTSQCCVILSKLGQWRFNIYWPNIRDFAWKIK